MVISSRFVKFLYLTILSKVSITWLRPTNSYRYDGIEIRMTTYIVSPQSIIGSAKRSSLKKITISLTR